MWQVADNLAREWTERQLAATDALPLRPTRGKGSLYWRRMNRRDGMN
jgi:hypothetical protein